MSSTRTTAEITHSSGAPLSLAITLATAAALSLAAGCSKSPEQVAREQAEAAAAAEAADKARLATDIAAFPSRANDDLIPALDALSLQSVSGIDGAAATIQQFQSARSALRRVDGATLTAEGESARSVLAEKLKRKQVQLYPAMRLTYAREFDSNLLGQPVTVRATGPKNKTLRFNSPAFGSESTVMEAHYTLASQAVRFRFNRAEYVYSGDGTTRTFKINGDSDADLESY